MSLLENFPHKCKITLRIRTLDEFGGGYDERQNVVTNLSCWEQQASATEIKNYQKRGINITRKVFFTSDPNVTEQHFITITERNGVALSVENQVELAVVSEPEPDASAGLGVVWRVMCNYVTGENQ